MVSKIEPQIPTHRAPQRPGPPSLGSAILIHIGQSTCSQVMHQIDFTVNFWKHFVICFWNSLAIGGPDFSAIDMWSRLGLRSPFWHLLCVCWYLGVGVGLVRLSRYITETRAVLSLRGWEAECSSLGATLRTRPGTQYVFKRGLLLFASSLEIFLEMRIL